MSLRCWLFGHDYMHPRARRDRGGAVVRGQITMACLHCGHIHQVEIDLTPNWGLTARLRRQVPWSRRRTRAS